jgi:hypothetical protein
VSQNQLPLVSSEWMVAVIRERLNEIKEDAIPLQTVSEQHWIPEEIREICQEIWAGICRLDNHLSQLETSLDRYRGIE